MRPSAQRAVAEGADAEGVGGAGEVPSMVYVAEERGRDYANAALSVYWDAIHGDTVHPRPILTYNPESLLGNASADGEVFRVRFKHVHLPTATTYLEAEEAISEAHQKEDGRLFWAGAYTHGFSLSHSGAMLSGMDAAVSVGARDPAFVRAMQAPEPDGFEEGMRTTAGKNLFG